MAPRQRALHVGAKEGAEAHVLFLSPSFANLEGHVAADGRGVCAVKWHRGSTDRDIAGGNREKGRPSISEVLYIQDQVKVAP